MFKISRTYSKVGATVLALLFSITASAQKDILGIIISKNNHPVNRALVRVTNADDGMIIRNCYSGLKGEFLFQMVPKGNYFVETKKHIFMRGKSKPILIDDSDMLLNPITVKIARFKKFGKKAL